MDDAPLNSGEVTADQQLMEFVAQGDGDAMEQLYHRYHGLVLSFFQKHGLSDSDAEDLAQDVFVAVWKQAESYRPESGRVGTYLRAVACNHLRQLCRANGRYFQHTKVRANHDQDMKPDIPDVVQTVIRNILIGGLWSKLCELSEPQRHVLDLIYWQGLTVQEAAREMDCTRYRCESLHQKALKLLQRAHAEKEF